MLNYGKAKVYECKLFTHFTACRLHLTMSRPATCRRHGWSRTRSVEELEKCQLSKQHSTITRKISYHLVYRGSPAKPIIIRGPLKFADPQLSQYQGGEKRFGNQIEWVHFQCFISKQPIYFKTETGRPTCLKCDFGHHLMKF